VWPAYLNKRRRQRLAGVTYGLLFWPALRWVVNAAGYQVFPIFLGRFKHSVAVWGRLPSARKAVAKYGSETEIITFEDAFLRSVLPGPGTPPIGITIDDLGVHFDCASPSRLETILQTADLDDETLLRRAGNGRLFLQHYGLSKYNPVCRDSRGLPEKYVLVLDQVADDASIVCGNANADSFEKMLQAAVAENPGIEILIRAHPATKNRRKSGHFANVHEATNIRLIKGEHNPHDLLQKAKKVYCVTSQMGFEAIMAGHKPIVFGLPFYAGWGLSDDRQAIPRRTKKLTKDQLFAGAMLLFPFWFDRTTNRECTFEQAAQLLQVQAKHHQNGLRGNFVLGVQLWKRPGVRSFLNGAGQQPTFYESQGDAIAQAVAKGGKLIVWASKENGTLAGDCHAAGVSLVRMEDGFLRSNGLGAELTPAASFVLDDLGMHYDPSHPSRLEVLITEAVNLPEFALKRAQKLRAEIVKTGVTKYNLSAKSAHPKIPMGRAVILVPGQVEDDASILKGTTGVCTNIGLLQAARAANPSAYIIYKPHPDVLTGLRIGVISPSEMLKCCDVVADDVPLPDLLDQCDEVWTLTSLLGFEALLRGKKVTCLGTPFYAGWGLTHDLGASCKRRSATPTLDGMVHAALIDYPVYMDTVSGLPCTAEHIVSRLSRGETRRKPTLKILSKLQGYFVNYSRFWR